MSSAHASFKLIREAHLSALNLQATEYEHTATGAKHWHFNTDNTENVFLVAFRTVPMDNTGVAHILEHTSLCGSQKYPVRDPFFMMLRRSLNTFMNAFTSSDWTAYPFASKNKKDFENLLSVYLDAVFFPSLNPLDFAQEGHRLEFETPNDPNTPLEYKGVVYNEMKGAMSSVNSILYDTLNKHLFPSSTYHYNSGGDPESIPDLSYEDLTRFYASHYHPSNAVFMTFGDISAEKHQAFFEDNALKHFQQSDDRILVKPEKRLLAPIYVAESYGVANQEELKHNTHHVIGWLWGETTNLLERMEAELLSSALLDNSASPLRHALEKTELGNAPSALCGLEDSNLELSFMCGIEGSEPEQTKAFEKLVFEVLEQVAKDGIDEQELASVLHQLEFNQREISGDGFPYGLQVMLSGLTAAIHRSDVFDVLEIDHVLTKLRENIKDPNYIKQLTEKLLLNNHHRVQLALTPDAELNQRKVNDEKARLEKIKQNLNPAAQNQILQQAAALEQRQAEANDPSILPKVTKADVPDAYDAPSVSETAKINNISIQHYNQGTNGIHYQLLVTPLPALSPEHLEILPRYVDAITELGLGQEDYLTIQKRQSEITGGINAYASMRSSKDDINELSGYLVLSAKGLKANMPQLTELLYRTHQQLQFSELPRLQELVAQDLAHQEQAITGNGHGLAMASAAAGLSKLASLRFQLHGFKGFQSLKALNSSLADTQALKNYGQTLADLHQAIISGPTEIVTIAEDGDWSNIESILNKQWQGAAGQAQASSFSDNLSILNSPAKQAWVHNTQVNFCAKAYPTVSESHPDAPILQVLSAYLKNAYLHSAIREKGGAYGGGASHDGQAGAFRFFSYRDPRLVETLADFDLSVQQFLDSGANEEQLEEAVLGIISDIDAPASPAGEARASYFHDKFGRDLEFRRGYRNRVLQTQAKDLERVAAQYLDPTKAKTAIITSVEAVDALKGFDIQTL